MRQPDRAKPASEKTPAAQSPEVTDRVDISLDARTRLAEMADRQLKAQGFAGGEAPSRNDGAGGDRISDIRARIESGYYDRPEVRDRIISNLTDDLDLG